MWVAFALQKCKSYSHFFSKKFQHICVSLDVNFNESLTNDFVSFEQLGPGHDCKTLHCTGPSCSKLMMLLVNASLKLWSLNIAYMQIFLLKKMWVTQVFSKNTCELDIVLTRTVNVLTSNELVKLTMLWTTGPWSFLFHPFNFMIWLV